jgi:hypothetical protein
MDSVLGWAQRYMSAYASAFDRMQATTILDAYAVPTVFVTSSGTHVIGDRGTLDSGLKGLLSSYREAGYGRAQIEVLAARQLGERLRTVDTHWAILDQSDTVLWEFDVTYVLRHYEEGDGDRDDWRIATVVNPTGR